MELLQEPIYPIGRIAIASVTPPDDDDLFNRFLLKAPQSTHLPSAPFPGVHVSEPPLEIAFYDVLTYTIISDIFIKMRMKSIFYCLCHDIFG